MASAPPPSPSRRPPMSTPAAHDYSQDYTPAPTTPTPGGSTPALKPGGFTPAPNVQGGGSRGGGGGASGAGGVGASPGAQVGGFTPAPGATPGGFSPAPNLGGFSPVGGSSALSGPFSAAQSGGFSAAPQGNGLYTPAPQSGGFSAAPPGAGLYTPAPNMSLVSGGVGRAGESGPAIQGNGLYTPAPQSGGFGMSGVGAYSRPMQPEGYQFQSQDLGMGRDFARQHDASSLAAGGMPPTDSNLDWVAGGNRSNNPSYTATSYQRGYARAQAKYEAGDRSKQTMWELETYGGLNQKATQKASAAIGVAAGGGSLTPNQEFDLQMGGVGGFSIGDREFKLAPTGYGQSRYTETSVEQSGGFGMSGVGAYSRPIPQRAPEGRAEGQMSVSTATIPFRPSGTPPMSTPVSAPATEAEIYGPPSDWRQVSISAANAAAAKARATYGPPSVQTGYTPGFTPKTAGNRWFTPNIAPGSTSYPVDVEVQYQVVGHPEIGMSGVQKTTAGAVKSSPEWQAEKTAAIESFGPGAVYGKFVARNTKAGVLSPQDIVAMDRQRANQYEYYTTPSQIAARNVPDRTQTPVEGMVYGGMGWLESTPLNPKNLPVVGGAVGFYEKSMEKGGEALGKTNIPFISTGAEVVMKTLGGIPEIPLQMAELAVKTGGVAGVTVEAARPGVGGVAGRQALRTGMTSFKEGATYAATHPIETIGPLIVLHYALGGGGFKAPAAAGEVSGDLATIDFGLGAKVSRGKVPTYTEAVNLPKIEYQPARLTEEIATRQATGLKPIGYQTGAQAATQTRLVAPYRQIRGYTATQTGADTDIFMSVPAGGKGKMVTSVIAEANKPFTSVQGTKMQFSREALEDFVKNQNELRLGHKTPIEGRMIYAGWKGDQLVATMYYPTEAGIGSATAPGMGTILVPIERGPGAIVQEGITRGLPNAEGMRYPYGGYSISAPPDAYVGTKIGNAFNVGRMQSIPRARGATEASLVVRPQMSSAKIIGEPYENPFATMKKQSGLGSVPYMEGTGPRSLAQNRFAIKTYGKDDFGLTTIGTRDTSLRATGEYAVERIETTVTKTGEKIETPIYARRQTTDFATGKVVDTEALQPRYNIRVPTRTLVDKFGIEYAFTRPRTGGPLLKYEEGTVTFYPTKAVSTGPGGGANTFAPLREVGTKDGMSLSTYNAGRVQETYIKANLPIDVTLRGTWSEQYAQGFLLQKAGGKAGVEVTELGTTVVTGGTGKLQIMRETSMVSPIKLETLGERARGVAGRATGTARSGLETAMGKMQDIIYGPVNEGSSWNLRGPTTNAQRIMGGQPLVGEPGMPPVTSEDSWFGGKGTIPAKAGPSGFGTPTGKVLKEFNLVSTPEYNYNRPTSFTFKPFDVKPIPGAVSAEEGLMAGPSITPNMLYPESRATSTTYNLGTGTKTTTSLIEQVSPRLKGYGGMNREFYTSPIGDISYQIISNKQPVRGVPKQYEDIFNSMAKQVKGERVSAQSFGMGGGEPFNMGRNEGSMVKSIMGGGNEAVTKTATARQSAQMAGGYAFPEVTMDMQIMPSKAASLEATRGGLFGYAGPIQVPKPQQIERTSAFQIQGLGVLQIERTSAFQIQGLGVLAGFREATAGKQKPYPGMTDTAQRISPPIEIFKPIYIIKPGQTEITKTGTDTIIGSPTGPISGPPITPPFEPGGGPGFNIPFIPFGFGGPGGSEGKGKGGSGRLRAYSPDLLSLERAFGSFGQ